MAWFFSVPALAKVLIIFTLVLVLNRTGLHLGLSLILGALGMSLWFEQGFLHSLQIILQGGVNLECFFLIIVIFEILSLTLLMSHTGMMNQMIRNVRSILPSRRMALATLPAMIGLLPMPGGAAVSAPMVDAADEDRKIDPLDKTTINYWFRHSWEYWWPLYPGIILASEISGLSLGQIAMVQMPLTLFSVGFGAFFLLRPLKLGPRKKRPQGNLLQLVTSFLPILILFFLWLILGKAIKYWFPVDAGTDSLVGRVITSKYFPMMIGLVGAILWVQFTGKPGKKAWKDIITKKRSYLLLVVVFGVKVFSAALESDVGPVNTTPPLSGVSASVAAASSVATEPETTRVVDLIRANLDTLEIPDILVIVIMPFISGIVTGLAFGFVGASFPIVMSLLGEGSSTAQVMSYVVLAFGFGYMGMMLSPVHVCFVVTNEYFKTRMLQSYRKLIGPTLGVLLGAIIMSFIAMRFG